MIHTAEGGTIGGTSVTAESIYTRDPEDAISDQEKLAAEELKRQRIKRARRKNNLCLDVGLREPQRLDLVGEFFWNRA